MQPFIEEIRLHQYRNLDQVGLKVGRAPIVLTGANGAGKTNILEAISYFSPGRGMRGEPLQMLSQQKETIRLPWAAHVKVNRQGHINEIGMGQDPNSEKDKRLIRIDGTKAGTQKKLAELLNVIWITPSMDRLLTDSTTDRRRFLDRCVYGIDPEHADRLSLYEKKLRERVVLLQSESIDRQWLEQLESEIVELGLAIIEARNLYLQLLEPYTTEDTLFPYPISTLQGKTEDYIQKNGRDAARLFYLEQLKALRAVDKEVGGSRIGPHRVDLQVLDGRNKKTAHFCSTGELKGLLIAFVLAHCRFLVYKGKAPIVLLDEVVAHLDPLRREKLCSEILALDLQAWMTGTETHFFDAFGSKAHYYTMQDGRILEEKV